MQQNGFTKQERERIKKLYETVLERIYTAHIKPFPDFPEPVFFDIRRLSGRVVRACVRRG